MTTLGMQRNDWVLAVYAALGCDGLLHYTRAPMEAHTAAMNFTIWFEVVAAALLLATVLAMAVNRSPR
jgi:hypothetical protein